jgi:hypothetical protein
MFTQLVSYSPFKIEEIIRYSQEPKILKIKQLALALIGSYFLLKTYYEKEKMGLSKSCGFTFLAGLSFGGLAANFINLTRARL